VRVVRLGLITEFSAGPHLVAADPMSQKPVPLKGLLYAGASPNVCHTAFGQNLWEAERTGVVNFLREGGVTNIRAGTFVHPMPVAWCVVRNIDKPANPLKT
jgi:hypothetical protein